MILNISQIAKKYGKQSVLNDLSFSISRGEIVGFLGPNGAGKSTAMKIMTGCIPPDQGTVTIGNYAIAQYPLKAKALIGYLPENTPLYDEMYVAEYLEYVVRLYERGYVAEKVRKAMMQTGLQPEAHKKIGQLSKGYRQRVGIAQAIIHNPQLLILDEPTSGLDPNQIEEINRLLLSLSAEKAILLSSHTLAEVSAICTRVIIIHQGSLVADMPVKEIENLEKLFKDLTSTSIKDYAV